jgi:hypothetical protein
MNFQTNKFYHILFIILVFYSAIVHGQPIYKQQAKSSIKLICSIKDTVYKFDEAENQPKFDGGKLPFLTDIQMFKSRSRYVVIGKMPFVIEKFTGSIPGRRRNDTTSSYNGHLSVLVTSKNGQDWSKNISPALDYKKCSSLFQLSQDILGCVTDSLLLISRDNGESWARISLQSMDIDCSNSVPDILFYRDRVTNIEYLFTFKVDRNKEYRCIVYNFKSKHCTSNILLKINPEDHDVLENTRTHLQITESGVLFFSIVSYYKSKKQTFAVVKSPNLGLSWVIENCFPKPELLFFGGFTILKSTVLITISFLKNTSYNSVQTAYSIGFVTKTISENNGDSWREFSNTTTDARFPGGEIQIFQNFGTATGPDNCCQYLSSDLIHWVTVPDEFLQLQTKALLILGKDYESNIFYILKDHGLYAADFSNFY